MPKPDQEGWNQECSMAVEGVLDPELDQPFRFEHPVDVLPMPPARCYLDEAVGAVILNNLRIERLN